MKVMQVIHGLNMGGAETLVKEYALNLDKSKFEVVVLCLEHFKDSPYENILKNANIKVIYICDEMKYYKKQGIFFDFYNRLERLVLIRKHIHEEKPAILHTHLHVNKYLKFAKLQKGVKIFHTIHSDPERYIQKDKNNYKATKYLVKKYNMRFICLHEDMKNTVNRLFGVNNSLVLNNGIDFLKFENALAKEVVRKKLKIPADAFVIGHVGRFDIVKNHKFIVEVFNEIHKKNNKAFLLLVGDGDEGIKKVREQLQDLNLEKAYLILSQRTDIPDLLNSLDCFLFPSLSEGLGISVIEAQKMKIPCFISLNVPDFAIISNFVTKISLTDSKEVWADKILNYKLPKEMILNDKDWNIKEVTKKLEQIYLSGE